VTSPSPYNGRTQGPRWSREQIRAARLVALVPLLEKRGLQLIAREAGNFILPAYPGLIVKDSYWRWPEQPLPSSPYDGSPAKSGRHRRKTVLRSQRGKAAESR